MREIDQTELLATLESIKQRLAMLESIVSETRQLVGPFGVPFPDGS